MHVDTIIGIFEDRVEADLAIQDCQDHGYDPKDISIITRRPVYADADERIGSKGGSAAAGATAGGILGGLAGLLIGLGAVVIPGGGIFLIGGPIAALLGLTGAAATAVTGAVTGVLAGGAVGALVMMGLPENEARDYERRIRGGAILLAVPVRTDNANNEVTHIFKSHQASQVRKITRYARDVN